MALEIQNLMPAFNADLYFGALLPDGVTVFFFTSLSPLNGVLTRVDANPQSFPPLTPSMFIPQGLDIMLNDIFVYTFSGSEPAGTYVFFAFLTPPSAFIDSTIDPGDFLALDVQAFTFSP